MHYPLYGYLRGDAPKEKTRGAYRELTAILQTRFDRLELVLLRGGRFELTRMTFHGSDKQILAEGELKAD